jgi:hypothetical protein
MVPQSCPCSLRVGGACGCFSIETQASLSMALLFGAYILQQRYSPFVTAKVMSGNLSLSETDLAKRIDQNRKSSTPSPVGISSTPRSRWKSASSSLLSAANALRRASGVAVSPAVGPSEQPKPALSLAAVVLAAAKAGQAASSASGADVAETAVSPSQGSEGNSLTVSGAGAGTGAISGGGAETGAAPNNSGGASPRPGFSLASVVLAAARRAGGKPVGDAAGAVAAQKALSKEMSAGALAGSEGTGGRASGDRSARRAQPILSLSPLVVASARDGVASVPPTSPVSLTSATSPGRSLRISRWIPQKLRIAAPKKRWRPLSIAVDYNVSFTLWALVRLVSSMAARPSMFAAPGF